MNALGTEPTIAHPGRLSVNWYRQHRRSEEIARVVQAEARYFRAESRLLPLRYLSQWRATRRALDEVQPDVVVVMQPPPFALFAVTSWARRRPHVAILGDLHSGVFFDPKWRPFRRMVLARLRRRGAAIVPNDELAALTRAGGVETFVCHGLIEPVDRLPAGSSSIVDGPFVLVPLTFADDEPIDAILAAARATPDVRWVLTGRAPRAVEWGVPANVTLSGYVSVDDYDVLRRSASVIVALTTRDSTMQSAGYEALATAVPLVTVPTRVLTDYFGDAASYVDNSPEQIAAAVTDSLARQEEWGARMVARRSAVVAGQDLVVEQIRAWVAARSAVDS